MPGWRGATRPHSLCRTFVLLIRNVLFVLGARVGIGPSVQSERSQTGVESEENSHASAYLAGSGHPAGE
jgi:hypothetical protein